MEAEEILQNIFGPDIFPRAATSKAEVESVKYSRTTNGIDLANNYILNTLTEDDSTKVTGDNRIGRIGPRLVRFDTSAQHGYFVLSPDRLNIHSGSTFSTIRANTGVYKGKWMYELQLGSRGVMQVGWGTTKCKFNDESGVGDTVNSFSYDGNRVRKWNVATHKYGESWLTGDIIGCALDMDDGTIDFYRNGRHLGRAFENIPMGAGIAYFPIASLGITENLTANFGSTPMRYPVEGYQPLQAMPMRQICQATVLFEWLSRIIEALSTIKDMGEENIYLEDRKMSGAAFILCLARSVFAHMGPLLTIPYITDHLLIPFMQQRTQSKVHSELSICLDLFWTFLEEREMKTCLENTIGHLLSSFRHVSVLLEYPNQCKSLILLTKICQHSVTRQYLLQYLFFDRLRFANFVHVQPLDEGGLADLIGNVWWETNPVDSEVEVNKESYLRACERIKEAVSEVETLQVELLVTLLDNSDGDAKRPASRTIFLRKFKTFVQENLTSSRTMSILQTPLPVTLCCFYRLLVAFRVLWDAEIDSSPVYVPCRAFYDASINYFGIDRLGGVLSHLNKTFKSELVHLLGPEHEVIINMEQTQDTSSAFGGSARLSDLPVVIPPFARASSRNWMIFERLGFLAYNREDRTPMRLNTADPVVSLLELLDVIILFFHVAAKKQLANVARLRDSMSEFVAAIADTKSRLELLKANQDEESQLIQKELLRTLSVFNTKLSIQARHMAWIRAAVYSEDKQLQLSWLLNVVTLTLKNASTEGNMFSFVPEFYLEALADLCVCLRNHMHPTARIERIPGYRELFIDAAEFLCEHFLDQRIVHVKAKDTLILTLAGFVSNPFTLEALENVPWESRVKVVMNLLKPYENRAWAQSNWVLVRFWQGSGFAFRYERSPHVSREVGPKVLQQETISQPIKPCPSVVYQDHVRDALLSNPQATTKFLNSLLNQLNWAFSEFIGMVQEIQNASTRPERVVIIEKRHLKICATCFVLAISLLRVLEMISTVAPSVFNHPLQSSSENLLSRLCQLLCQVLNRMGSQTSCFQHVVLLEIPDLESVDHFPILAAVIGVLLALLKKDMSSYTSKPLLEVPKVTRTLLSEPNFQMTSLHFVLGESKLKSTKARDAKSFSFLNYPDDVTEEEIERVKDMIEYLDTCLAILPNSESISDDNDICTICYALPIEATFKPCNHQTCRVCIDRHLLNTRECFFCKAAIDKVVDLCGVTLHEFPSELST